jgi:hypothetical protein
VNYFVSRHVPHSGALCPHLLCIQLVAGLVQLVGRLLGGPKRASPASGRHNYWPYSAFLSAPDRLLIAQGKKAKLTRAPGVFIALALLTVHRMPWESYRRLNPTYGIRPRTPSDRRTSIRSPPLGWIPPQTGVKLTGAIASASLLVLPVLRQSHSPYRPNRKAEKATAFLRVRSLS